MAHEHFANRSPSWPPMKAKGVRARDNDVTQAELVETITQLAFYAGWPNAITAIPVAKG